MAESDSGDKTEKPSAQKLRKAREQGQVARSRDLITAVGILAAFKLTVALLPSFLEDFRTLFALGFAPLDGEGALMNAGSTSFQTTLMLLVRMVLPLLIVPGAVLVASLIPGGWAPSMKNWAPNFGRLSPLANLKRLAGGKHFFEFGVSIAKVSVLIGVLWHVTRSTSVEYLRLQTLPLPEALARGADLMVDGVFALCCVFLIFAAIDLPAQVFFFMRQQRMSKKDLKDEHKQTEGNPQIRGRIRQLQRQIAMRSARKTVPGADVVIVNPEHYAVALKYDTGRAEAPFVIAKGMDEVALYIRQVADEHGVEVVSVPPLARAVYHTSQVNQQIPMTLYHAVALVLHHVLQLKAFRAGKRPTQPQLASELNVPRHLSDPEPAPEPAPVSAPKPAVPAAGPASPASSA